MQLPAAMRPSCSRSPFCLHSLLCFNFFSSLLYMNELCYFWLIPFLLFLLLFPLCASISRLHAHKSIGRAAGMSSLLCVVLFGLVLSCFDSKSKAN